MNKKNLAKTGIKGRKQVWRNLHDGVLLWL